MTSPEDQWSHSESQHVTLELVSQHVTLDLGPLHKIILVRSLLSLCSIEQAGLTPCRCVPITLDHKGAISAFALLTVGACGVFGVLGRS